MNRASHVDSAGMHLPMHSSAVIALIIAVGYLAISGADLPKPWGIAVGPRRLPQGHVDGQAWLFTLERDGVERSLIVVISRRAFEAGETEKMPVETREAIATDGRSEAARVAQFDDPTSCVVLGTGGYLPPPPALMRLTRH